MWILAHWNVHVLLTRVQSECIWDLDISSPPCSVICVDYKLINSLRAVPVVWHKSHNQAVVSVGWGEGRGASNSGVHLCFWMGWLLPLFAEPHSCWVYTCRPSPAGDCIYAPYPNLQAQKIQLAVDPLKGEWGEREKENGFTDMKEEDSSYATTVYFLSQTRQTSFPRFFALFLQVSLSVFSQISHLLGLIKR